MPARVAVDNGHGSTSEAIDERAYEGRVELHFIGPGRPIENRFIARFNGKFREDCLNLQGFRRLQDARQTTENWRVEYHWERPHSSLGDLPLMEFARQSAVRSASPPYQLTVHTPGPESLDADP